MFHTNAYHSTIVKDIQCTIPIFSATITRTNIAFYVYQLKHFPSNVHWKSLKRLFHYLNETACMGLLFSYTKSLHLNCYVDSDWGGNSDDRWYTSGFAIVLANWLISWLGKKQATVAQPSNESEYKAIANATSELIRIQSLPQELGFPINQSRLHCSNI